MSGRIWLTLGTVAFAGLVYLLMLRGWRSRQRRQGDLPLPPPMPEDPGDVILGGTAGLFVGTTTDQDWLDRVAVHSLSDRSAAWLTVFSSGVGVEREGLDDLWLPYGQLRDAEPGTALAGKVVARDGLLVLTWQLGARTLRSAFRADDHAAHRRIADAVRAHLTAETT